MNPYAGHPADVASLCAICQSPMQADQALVACPECRVPYHTECWEENGGCAIYGCAQVPKVEMRAGMEIPASFWGREHKPCPSCGAEILAAAVRCRHCGATFSSAQPEDAGTFRKRTRLDQLAPTLGRQAVWMFIFCVLPCTAPVAAIIALFWWGTHRQEIEALPALHSGLARLALIVGLGQTIIAAIMGSLFAVFRST